MPSVEALPIPDYDELSASQVVERLDGLDHDSLEAIRRYETEHTTAEVLQRSLLPDALPQSEGIALAARYLPAAGRDRIGEAGVGGGESCIGGDRAHPVAHRASRNRAGARPGIEDGVTGGGEGRELGVEDVIGG